MAMLDTASTYGSRDFLGNQDLTARRTSSAVGSFQKDRTHWLSLRSDEFVGVMRLAEICDGTQVVFSSDRANPVLSAEIRNLRSFQSDDEIDIPAPTRATIAEALWVAGFLDRVAAPTVRVLDQGEIVLSWVGSGHLIDLQFDGSGTFCAYVGFRPKTPVLKKQLSITSPEIKRELVPAIIRVLNGPAPTA